MLEEDPGRTCRAHGERSTHWSSLLAGPVAPHRIHAGADHKVQQPTLEKFMENCPPRVRPHMGAGDKCERSPSPKEEGTAKTMYDEYHPMQTNLD